MDFIPGTRIRDRLTGATGTVLGYATIHLIAGSRREPLIHFDGATNATPWPWATSALEVTT